MQMQINETTRSRTENMSKNIHKMVLFEALVAMINKPGLRCTSYSLDMIGMNAWNNMTYLFIK